MKWTNLQPIDFMDQHKVPTLIECPKCGKHIFLDNTVVLTSFPPQYCYWCECGWTGSSYSKDLSAYYDLGEENVKIST
jgi:hypothetical protein